MVGNEEIVRESNRVLVQFYVKSHGLEISDLGAINVKIFILMVF